VLAVENFLTVEGQIVVEQLAVVAARQIAAFAEGQIASVVGEQIAVVGQLLVAEILVVQTIVVEAGLFLQEFAETAEAVYQQFAGEL